MGTEKNRRRPAVQIPMVFQQETRGYKWATTAASAGRVNRWRILFSAPEISHPHGNLMVARTGFGRTFSRIIFLDWNVTPSLLNCLGFVTDHCEYLELKGKCWKKKLNSQSSTQIS